MIRKNSQSVTAFNELTMWEMTASPF